MRPVHSQTSLILLDRPKSTLREGPHEKPLREGHPLAKSTVMGMDLPVLERRGKERRREKMEKIKKGISQMVPTQAKHF